jgi:flagellar motor protein MotB
MGLRFQDVIEFPANPFVALADFVIVLLIILVLTIVEQSITNSSLIARASVAGLQKEINSAVRQIAPPNLAHGIVEREVDGDLQRFRIDGANAFAPDSAVLKPRGRALLIRFGEMLAARQGNPYREERPFKRITIEGHADPAEMGGEEDAVWRLSEERAACALSVLRHETSLHPTLMEASGHGQYDPVMNRGDAPLPIVERSNRSLEVIVVYSGDIAIRYLQGRRGRNQP